MLVMLMMGIHGTIEAPSKPRNDAAGFARYRRLPNDSDVEHRALVGLHDREEEREIALGARRRGDAAEVDDGVGLPAEVGEQRAHGVFGVVVIARDEEGA